MDLRPGIALGVTPRFQNGRPWRERLQINSGVEGDGRRVFPRRDWRAVGPIELGALMEESPGVTGARASLLSVPRHVRTEWWKLADRAESSRGRPDGDEAFAAELVDFLRFKRVPLPVRCRFDVVASRPAQPSTRWDAAAGCLAGLGFSASLDAGRGSIERVVAVINLGDEETHLVLLNLPPSEMASLLAAATGGALAAPAGAELVEPFFQALPGYPLIRLRLDPGDGLWFPDCGMVYDGCTHGKVDIDVVLAIHDAGQLVTEERSHHGRECEEDRAADDSLRPLRPHGGDA